MTTRPSATLLLACVAWVLGAHVARGQEPAPAPADAPTVRVFIDCNNTPCDSDFFRTEITFVEHVRDRQSADVHLLMTGQSTGSGGREITFSFFGQGRFKGRDHVLKDSFLVASSDDDVRRGMVRVMALGLVPYVLDTAAADRLKVTLDAAATATSTQPSDDPWNRWSLRINLNGNASGERSSTYLQFNTNFNANRTTEATKVNLNVRMNYRQNRFELPDGRTFLSPNRDSGANGQYVKSLNGHWSAGVRTNWNSSTFSNNDFTWSIGPAIEWDLFPCAESTRRLLTFNYSVGVRAWNYARETIYGNLSLNLVKGLSFNLNTSIDSIRDQITLPRADVTSEEVLVNQRELATSYRYFVFFGVSYTFGSIFSPIVNPRFSGG